MTTATAPTLRLALQVEDNRVLQWVLDRYQGHPASTANQPATGGRPAKRPRL